MLAVLGDVIEEGYDVVADEARVKRGVWEQ